MVEANTTRARILIVDDEAQIRGILYSLLSEEYSCVETASAEEALELIRVEQFDLILSDIMMAGMSGLDMIVEARQLAPETVIVMISGEQTIDKAITAMRAGAFDYITKPFELQQVLITVQTALDYRAMREAKRRYEADLEELVKRRTAELDHVSLHDPITGLPNRALFEDHLGRALATAKSSGHSLALVFFDLDRFKQINDALGYRVGDRILRQVAKRLMAFGSEDDVVARIGGDEFARCVSRMNSPDDAVLIAHRIHEALKPAFEIDGHELFITASIGISIYPNDGLDTQTLLKNATAALYRDQHQAGDNYQFYSADMNDRALRRLTLESLLRRAVERQELVVHYQPKIEIKTKRMVGMEALMRWHAPELGMVSPAEFIPIAEKSGLIVPIGEWILRAACVQNKLWQSSDLDSLRVAVNLSARQFQQPNLTTKVSQILDETGLDSHYLELEITESSIMRSADSAMRTLLELREMGIEISIDDFGTGYSSLGYLKQLPIDTLKIDQSFVREMITEPASAAIVQTIIALAHNLNQKVVAEGVETEEQLKLLDQLGCDQAQGYLFSKPLSAKDFELLLK